MLREAAQEKMQRDFRWGFNKAELSTRLGPEDCYKCQQDLLQAAWPSKKALLLLLPAITLLEHPQTLTSAESSSSSGSVGPLSTVASQ